MNTGARLSTFATSKFKLPSLPYVPQRVRIDTEEQALQERFTHIASQLQERTYFTRIQWRNKGGGGISSYVIQDLVADFVVYPRDRAAPVYFRMTYVREGYNDNTNPDVSFFVGSVFFFYLNDNNKDSTNENND